MGKKIWVGLFVAVAFTFNGVCLTPTSPVISLPTVASRGEFINYRLTADGYLSISYKLIPSGDIQSKRIKIEQSKKTEYIIAKLMYARGSQSPVSHKGELILFYKDASDNIVGVGFETYFEINNSLFKLVFFTDASNNDIVYITIQNSVGDKENYSFNIFENTNALDLDYIVGQLIGYPLGDEFTASSPTVKVIKSGTTFESIEFEWPWEPPILSD
jgi:hypothetical protein